MKPQAKLILFLLVLAAVAGYLLSKASLVGRVGISLFYKEYGFLKVWWQGGLLIFAVWMLLLFLQGRVQKKTLPSRAAAIHSGAVVLALIGLYFTYQDFRNTLSHRWLGERFHLGGYLFWIGWIIISVFYLTRKRKAALPANEVRESARISSPAGDRL